MHVLCTIPARGGSKGIPRKNLQTVAGISLVGHAVLAARDFCAAESAHQCTIIVDTDDDEIAIEARCWGAVVPFLRSRNLATDEASTVDCVIALLQRLSEQGRAFDAVIILQPTSPLRSGADVEACWSPVASGAAPSAVAVVREGHPIEHAMRVDDRGRIRWVGRTPPSRRQDAEDVFRPSGAVYVTRVDRFRETQKLIVEGETLGVERPTARSIDVDVPADLELVRAVRMTARPTPVALGDRVIGNGFPCFVIAEAGVNHNGDAELAHRLVDVAAESGANAVKFQIFDAAQLVAPDASKAAYQASSTPPDETQLAMLSRLSLPISVFRDLRDHALERGLMFLSTPFDSGSADALESLGVPALKVASGEITNHAFLVHLARKTTPLLISTGMCDMVDVAEALAVVRRNGNPPVALFHCVTNYPAAAADCNLSAMATMRAAFGVPVGWSDHTEGITLSLAAAAMGAELIEKHFTLDRDLPGPDHLASLEPTELSALVSGVRAIDAARGTGEKRPTDSERPLALVARRSVHATRTLPAGTVLTSDDLVALRPGTGIPPSRLDSLIGRRLRVGVDAMARLSLDDLEP